VRLSSSHKLFGQERETVDEAWPGDVIGLVGHSEFGIGDTLTQDKAIRYDEIPRFPPEVFTYITNPNAGDAKKYRAGLEQLLQEGVVQAFTAKDAPPGATLLAAVGPLQFEVVQWRLQSEYARSRASRPRLGPCCAGSSRTRAQGPLATPDRRHRRQLRRRQVRPPRRAFSVERVDDALFPGKEPGTEAARAASSNSAAEIAAGSSSNESRARQGCVRSTSHPRTSNRPVSAKKCGQPKCTQCPVHNRHHSPPAMALRS
jgi:hypothetical protein